VPPCFLFLILTLLAPAARAADDAPASDATAPKMIPAAQALYEQGLARYQAKEYAAAIRAFEEGFALEPRREFLFANAQARRLAGDCRGAVPLYQRFLEMSPPEVQASATHIALARCAQQMATEKPPAPPPPVTPVRPIEPPKAPPPPAPWTSDRVGAGLMIAGAAGLVFGGAFLVAAFSAQPDDDGVASWDEFDRQAATADRRATIAAVGLAGGGALVAAGVARYAWVRHRARATLTVVPGGLALGGAF
jgi:tetratricopeptide (TPR) repeat protein